MRNYGIDAAYFVFDNKIIYKHLANNDIPYFSVSCVRNACLPASPNPTEIGSGRKLRGLACPTGLVVVYPLPWPLLVGGVRCSRLWSTSQLLRPSGQQCRHSGGVCPQIQGRQCGAYVGAVEEMMCVVCVDVTEGA